jgi:hypothetical protein
MKATQVNSILISSDPATAADEIRTAVGLVAVMGGTLHIQPAIGDSALALNVHDGRDLVLLVKSLEVVILQLAEAGII